MTQQKKQWSAIIIMIALFAMIAFVTNLCSPMAIIVKNDFGASNVLAQIGNYGNFIAYLVMGIPAGMLIAKYGYKKTALIGLAIGIIGILIQWLSGHVGKESAFLVYLIGAFTSGFTMCILNCVVNPMLNLLGGGGNKGNQLIQLGGVFNSTAAVACYILMGALIGDAAKAHIADATPALMIALAIFVIAFVVIMFTKIEEPEQAPAEAPVTAQEAPAPDAGAEQEAAAPQKKAKKKAQHHAAPLSGISAIDYTTEYSDWLMPTPPTNAIPIVAEEPEEPEIENHKEPEKSHANPNIPEQMELFS